MDQIQFIKDRQWHTVNYTLLLIGAIIVFVYRTKILTNLPGVEVFICLFLGMIGIFSIFFFQMAHAKSLVEYRVKSHDYPEGIEKKRLQNTLYTGFFISVTLIGTVAGIMAVAFFKVTGNVVPTNWFSWFVIFFISVVVLCLVFIGIHGYL